ncbi:YD repeat protein [Shigella dysenteriae 155-74]|nr:YD repeat protein [Shigella dysenteriae 155-74]
MVICFDLAIDQIAQSGLSSLKVIYYSAQLFREEHVLNEILKSKNLFNEAEIAHAIKYVEGLREKFMMGLIN